MFAEVLRFLQPILIPFAVAGVLAYLLDPVVNQLISWGIPRRYSVISVFAAVSALVLLSGIWLIPNISRQTVRLYHKIDFYTSGARSQIDGFATSVRQNLRQKLGFDVLPSVTDPTDEEISKDHAATSATAVNGAQKAPANLEELIDLQQILKGDWLKNSITLVINNSIRMVRSSVGGFLSVFGFLLSLIIIPIYLFYFLLEAPIITQSWQDYIPLRASRFKNEVVSVLTEINVYIIAFFRGQLLVSLINGTATAIGLSIVQLENGPVIGFALCFLGLIPYVGILICWIPAVIIASMQNGQGTWISNSPGWLFPVVVTGIFVIVQKIDSFYITPKVVSSRVGLHPLTAIISLFVWSFLIGGLLGTLLAIPLTATLKVLLHRYIWQRQLIPASSSSDTPSEQPET